MPDVTVIVGCFMQEQYLEKAYWSAVNQDWKDGTIEVIINHDGCHVGKGTSASRARNRAIKNVTADWIICLDADDMLPCNYISALMERKAPMWNNWFAGCPVQFISGNELARFGDGLDSYYKIDDFKDTVPCIPSSAMFLRRAWEDVGGYDEAIVSMEDFDFWYKLLQAGYTYAHTQDTCLLKNNDGHGKVHRTPQSVRELAIERMNKKYGLELTVPEVVK